MGKETILVDRAGRLDEEVKEKKAELDEIKKHLKEFAQEKNLNVVQGKRFVAAFSDTSTTTVKEKKLFDYLKKQDRLDTLFKIVKVQMAAMRKNLKDAEINKFSEVELHEKNKITLTKKTD